jgi:hypothetical protein
LPVLEKSPPFEAIPDLTQRIRKGRLREAAEGYRRHLKAVSGGFSIRLEVDCLETSVRTAFREGGWDPRMFILPKDMRGRECFVVFLGLYDTAQEAMSDMATVPGFFTLQSSLPAVVPIADYL